MKLTFNGDTYVIRAKDCSYILLLSIFNGREKERFLCQRNMKYILPAKLKFNSMNNNGAHPSLTVTCDQSRDGWPPGVGWRYQSPDVAY